MTENKETEGYISENEDLAARAWRQGGRGDGAQASDHSLSFLRKHRRSNRFGGERPLNKYSLTGRGLLFRNQVEGINERTPLDTVRTDWHAQPQALPARLKASDADGRPGLGPGYRQAQAQARLRDLSDPFVHRRHDSGTTFSLFLSSTSSIIPRYFRLF